jgi:hypothetical protein
MHKFPQHWDTLTRINYLQRKIILCSISYYELNFNPVEDNKYDEWCKELVTLTSDCENVSESQYWYVYYDFDGTTGFQLYDRLSEKDKEYLVHLACRFRGR